MSHSQVSAQTELSALIPAEMLTSPSLMFPSKCFCTRKGVRRAFQSKNFIFMVWGALSAVSAFLPSFLAVHCVCTSRNASPGCSALWNDVSRFCRSWWCSVGLIPSAAWARVSQRTSVPFPEEVRLYKYVCLRTQPDGMPGAGISDLANLCPQG